MLDPCHLSGGAVSNSDLILDKFKLRSTFREREDVVLNKFCQNLYITRCKCYKYEKSTILSNLKNQTPHKKYMLQIYYHHLKEKKPGLVNNLDWFFFKEAGAHMYTQTQQQQQLFSIHQAFFLLVLNTFYDCAALRLMCPSSTRAFFDQST